MALHLTKVAFGIGDMEALQRRWDERTGGVFELTTRYLPKRHAEIAGPVGKGGSMFWIVRHRLVARTAILGFGEAEGGRVAIRLDPRLVLVRPQPRRAHQGWRYLEPDDAPGDLGGDAAFADDMPAWLVGELSALALI